MKKWLKPNLIEMEVTQTDSDWFREWGCDIDTDKQIGADNYITVYRSLITNNLFS